MNYWFLVDFSSFLLFSLLISWPILPSLWNGELILLMILMMSVQILLSPSYILIFVDEKHSYLRFYNCLSWNQLELGLYWVSFSLLTPWRYSLSAQSDSIFSWIPRSYNFVRLIESVYYQLISLKYLQVIPFKIRSILSFPIRPYCKHSVFLWRRARLTLGEISTV